MGIAVGSSARGRDQVSCEHLLAGVAHLSDGVRQILAVLDVDPSVIRIEIKNRTPDPPVGQAQACD